MREELFERTPVSKAVLSLAVPTMIGMLVVVIYNMADTFFVGKLNDANQVAAVSITMPIFLLLMAFGSILGIGGGTYISRLLGKKDLKKVKNTSSFSIYACIVVGIAAMVAGLVFMPQILNLSGASSNTYVFAESYLRVIAVGAVAIVLSFALGQIIRSEGASKQSMFGMMLGTVLNIILDPILILVFDMGVTGAAIATVIANIASVIYYVIYIVKHSTILSISIKDFSFDQEMIGNILAIGVPASLSNMLMSMANIILNNFAAVYGDNVVAALGVVGRTSMLPAMLCIGLGQGLQPLVGYNYGAGNIKRMREAIRFSVIVGTAICCFFTLIFFVGADVLIRVFINEPEVVKLGAHFMRIIAIAVPILGIQLILINTFQAMGKALPSLILSICRQGLVFIPMLFVLNAAFKLEGIAYAQPIADIVTVCITVIIYLKITKSFHVNKEDNLLL